MKQTGNKSWKQVALGSLLSIGLYLALAALLSLLVVRGTVRETAVTLWLYLFMCIAAFTGAKLASYKSGEPLVPGGLSVLIFWGVIQLVGFMANDTLEPTRSAATAFAAAIGSALACVLRPGKGKGKRAKHGRRSRK